MSGPDVSPGSSQKTTPSADAVMKGHGFYNEHSRPQQKADSLGLPLLERAVGERLCTSPVHHRRRDQGRLV